MPSTCKNCGMTACTSVLCKQHLSKTSAGKKAMAMPPSKKPAAKKPAAEKKAARQPAAKKPAVKSVIVKSKEVRAGKNVDPGYLAWRKAQSTAERNATIARRKAAAADFLTGAGPILGPALVALMRDPNKPPFNNSFRRNGRWMVPPGGVSNYPVCGANTDEATLNRAFGPHDLYCLEFHGEWKLKVHKKLKRILPACSYGKICSRHHHQAGLHGNFTSYAIEDGAQTEYEKEDFQLIVLHEERANLRASEWHTEALSCTYY
tara:strand:+ start:100 stop:885 length:786 start_codon:yes stop_codon:yes gene_type:complete